MDLIAIDLILWLGFGLLLWALKDSFKTIQSDLRNYRQPLRPRAEVKRDAIATPQRLIDPGITASIMSAQKKWRFA